MPIYRALTIFTSHIIHRQVRSRGVYFRLFIHIPNKRYLIIIMIKIIYGDLYSALFILGCSKPLFTEIKGKDLLPRVTVFIRRNPKREPKADRSILTGLCFCTRSQSCTGACPLVIFSLWGRNFRELEIHSFTSPSWRLVKTLVVSLREIRHQLT